MGQIKVIIGTDVVYATQYKTVVYKKSFSNDQEKEEALTAARSTAFSYATYESSSVCSLISWTGEISDDIVFSYLKKCHKPKPKPVQDPRIPVIPEEDRWNF